MNPEKLENFLNEANKATYANKEASKSRSLRPASEDYHFEKGELIYHDTYFGARDFIGEEIVYENNEPTWGANYFGYILDDDVDENEVYDFLREALMQEYNDIVPIRGPGQYTSREKKYTFDIQGDINNFLGEEEITFSEKVIYRCHIHGGFIK